MRSFIDRWLYREYADCWDELMLRSRILDHAGSTKILLDVGAGRGCKKHFDFRKEFSWVAGCDVSSDVHENPYLSYALVIKDGRMLFADRQFDVVFSSSVIEHVDDIDKHFEEIKRVLKPGGVFVAKTPNKRHYVALIASCTPDWFHEMVNRWRGRATRDTFPTHYRCNTPHMIEQSLERHGFSQITVETIEGRPEYCRIFSPLYLLGACYERLVNCCQLFAPFRAVMLVTAQV